MNRTILSGLFLFLTWGAAIAVPARRDARIVYQPDSTRLTVYAHGDEHFHWLTDATGQWIEQDETGYYHHVPALTPQQIAQRRAASPYRSSQQQQTASPLNIAPRGLIILAQFSDVSFSTDRATIDTMLIGENFTRQYDFTYNNKDYHVESEGSARQYFLESSYGQYNPQFDIVGPVTVSQTQEYYGSNSGGRDKNVQQLIKEACELAANEGTDFSLYDNDNDGYVDFVYIIYAGYGEADGGPAYTIWPHKHKLSQYTLRLNGKRVSMYACGNEMNFFSKRYFGIGQFVHEFGHVLGLPDIYSTGTDYNYKTLGEWDIMDYGPYTNDGNTPPAYSGYERFFCGWTQPRVLNEAENVVLGDLNTTNEVLLITETGSHNLQGNDPYPLTFYTLENRQSTGRFTIFPGHGLLLTRIAYTYSRWYYNTVNASKSAMGIDIIEADGLSPEYPANGWYGKATDAFPAGATEYKGINNYPITNIKEKDGIISFHFMGGAVTDVGETNATPVNEGKYLHNGQLYIRHNGKIYNTLGIRF